jgi:hypothetical protein
VLDKVKHYLGIARPGGIDDIVVRAAKTGLAAFAVFVLQEGVSNMTAELGQDALEAAYVAGATVILNALALLAPAE